MAARDYAAEMGAVVAEALGDGDVVAPVVAEKLHARLLEMDPDLLDGWLRSNAVVFLTRAIGDRDRRERSLSRTRSEARRFNAALRTGDAVDLSTFAVRLVVDDDNTRRPVGEMTGPDHLFVAAEYGRSAQTSLMLQAFHKAVATKVGKRKTSQVMDEATYERLYHSIVRPGVEDES